MALKESAMMTEELGGLIREDDISPDTLREVEIVALSLKGVPRLGHPGVPAPRSEEDSIRRGWLERLDLDDHGIYILLATDAGKHAVDQKRTREGLVPVAVVREQLQAALRIAAE